MENWQLRLCATEHDHSLSRALEQRLLAHDTQAPPVAVQPGDDPAITRCFLAFYEDMAIGGLRLVREPEQTRIEGIAVLPGFRRQGAGRALVRSAEEWAITEGIQELRLNSSPAGRVFFLSLGFLEEGVPRLEGGAMQQAMRRVLLSET